MLRDSVHVHFLDASSAWILHQHQELCISCPWRLTCYLRLSLWVEGVGRCVESWPGSLCRNCDPHPHPLQLAEAVGEQTSFGRILELLTMPCRHRKTKQSTVILTGRRQQQNTHLNTDCKCSDVGCKEYFYHCEREVLGNVQLLGCLLLLNCAQPQRLSSR